MPRCACPARRRPPTLRPGSVLFCPRRVPRPAAQGAPAEPSLGLTRPRCRSLLSGQLQSSEAGGQDAAELIQSGGLLLKSGGEVSKTHTDTVGTLGTCWTRPKVVRADAGQLGTRPVHQRRTGGRPAGSWRGAGCGPCMESCPLGPCPSHDPAALSGAAPAPSRALSSALPLAPALETAGAARARIGALLHGALPQTRAEPRARVCWCSGRLFRHIGAQTVHCRSLAWSSGVPVGRTCALRWQTTSWLWKAAGFRRGAETLSSRRPPPGEDVARACLQSGWGRVGRPLARGSENEERRC